MSADDLIMFGFFVVIAVVPPYLFGVLLLGSPFAALRRRASQETQEIIFFEPSGRYVASVNGEYLKRDRQTGYVQMVGRVGPVTFEHHADFCGSREAAEALLRQWNAQKLRAHHTRTPFNG